MASPEQINTEPPSNQESTLNTSGNGNPATSRNGSESNSNFLNNHLPKLSFFRKNNNGGERTPVTSSVAFSEKLEISKLNNKNVDSNPKEPTPAKKSSEASPQQLQLIVSILKTGENKALEIKAESSGETKERRRRTQANADADAVIEESKRDADAVEKRVLNEAVGERAAINATEREVIEIINKVYAEGLMSEKPNLMALSAVEAALARAEERFSSLLMEGITAIGAEPSKVESPKERANRVIREAEQEAKTRAQKKARAAGLKAYPKILLEKKGTETEAAREKKAKESKERVLKEGKTKAEKIIAESSEEQEKRKRIDEKTKADERVRAAQEKAVRAQKLCEDAEKSKQKLLISERARSKREAGAELEKAKIELTEIIKSPEKREEREEIAKAKERVEEARKLLLKSPLGNEEIKAERSQALEEEEARLEEIIKSPEKIGERQIKEEIEGIKAAAEAAAFEEAFRLTKSKAAAEALVNAARELVDKEILDDKVVPSNVSGESKAPTTIYSGANLDDDKIRPLLN
jgi:colicin import membrane protein